MSRRLIWGVDRWSLMTAQRKVEQGCGDAVGIVAEDVALVDEVAGDGFDAKGTDAGEVGLDGRLAFASVFFEQCRRDGRGVDEGVVEKPGVRQMRGFFPFAVLRVRMTSLVLMMDLVFEREMA